MNFPTDIYFTKEHLWVQPTSDGTCLSGITEYAQDLLGDIVYVEPPKVGTVIEAGKPCGLVESVKTGSDLHAPLNGTVTGINESLQGTPELINDKPYQAWIFKFTPHRLEDLEQLLTAEAYQALLG